MTRAFVMKFILWPVSLYLLTGLLSQSSAESLYSKVEKGNGLYAQEKFNDALSTYVDAQVEHPEDSKLKYNIASAHFKMKNYEEALKSYLETAATAQDALLEEKALYNAGNALYRQGKLEEAVEYYKKALALDPGDKEAQQNLEFVREEIKRKINEAKNTEQKQQEQKKQDEQQGDKKDKTCPNPQQQKSDQAQQDQKQQQGRDNQTGHSGQEEQKQDQQQEEASQPQDQKQQGEQQKQQQMAEAKAGKEGDAAEGEAAQGKEMTKEEAEQWLSSVQENRDKIKEGKKQVKTRGSNRSGKDW